MFGSEQRCEESVSEIPNEAAGHNCEFRLASHAGTEANVPDGGYGWIVFIATIYIRAVIPNILLGYGFFLLFLIIESGATIDSLWANNFVATPILFIAVQTLSDPICHLIVNSSKWPRFVFLCGVCLAAASILILWISIVVGFTSNALPMLSGSLSGFGTCLISLQVNIVIKQYFKLRRAQVEKILEAVECCGSLATCLILGKYLNSNGLAFTLVWYHLFVLLCGVAALIVRKPKYLKGRSLCDVVEVNHRCNADEDEEDIFSKTTELQSPHTSISTTVTNLNDQAINSSVNQRQHWERFSDDEDEHCDTLPAPRELFADSQINNNVTYSFDNNEIIDFAVNDQIFVPNTNQTSTTLTFFSSPVFYAICFLQITLRASSLVFFVLYPTYVYYTMTFLHKDTVPYLISLIILPLIPETLFIDWIKPSISNRRFYITFFLCLASGGNFLIGAFQFKPTLIIGGVLVTTSLYALNFISRPLMLNNGNTKLQYSCMKVIVGLAILVMAFSCTFSFQNCFRVMGYLQFAVGSLWLCSCTRK